MLPYFPGRNAPSWAIWSGAAESGATWHQVTECVDEGDCLWQKACRVTEDMKAYELAREIMEIAFEEFQEIFEDVLFENAEAVPQRKGRAGSEAYRLHYSYEVPGNGVFCLKDEAQDIYRMLRAVDYGLNRIFPNVKCVLDHGTDVEITAYKKIPHEAGHKDRMVDEMGRMIYIALDGENDLQLKYR